jgi:hypothetical protein
LFARFAPSRKQNTQAFFLPRALAFLAPINRSITAAVALVDVSVALEQRYDAVGMCIVSSPANTSTSSFELVNQITTLPN